jgi:signal transduction histidine kinase
MTHNIYRIYALLLISILFIFGMIMLEDSQFDVIWVNEHIHILLESIGAFSIILVSLLLFSDQIRLNYNCSSIITGLLLMGILDLFHGVDKLGQSFVFLHNMAGLFGSLGFLFFIPINIYKRDLKLTKKSIFIIMLLGVAIGTSTILFNQSLPLMVENGIFTDFSLWLNEITGAFFLAGCFYLTYIYTKEPDVIIFLLIITTLLLGTSSLTFYYSEIWCTSWWIWHLLRFLGNLLLIVFIFIFAEERRKLVFAQNTEIKEINNKLNNYTYTISHDLKEPIRSIRTFSEFILEDYEDKFDETGADYFNRIISASNKMAEMIDDLLLLSKIGKNDVEFEEIPLNSITDEVLTTLELAINEAHAHIECENLPTISCQITWMKLVFTNLISNCIKYRDEEKPELHISITCQRIGNNYEISIKDNGIGIDEDQHDKIFGLFRRAYSKKDKSGSGAGLAIVRDIIKQHNGDVYVKESTPVKGTTISFIIPMGGIKK